MKKYLFFVHGFDKILQYLDPRISAFFRVELSCRDILFLNAADKLQAVVGGGQDNGIILGGNVK
jgi:hypothetical protein